MAALHVDRAAASGTVSRHHGRCGLHHLRRIECDLAALAAGTVGPQAARLQQRVGADFDSAARRSAGADLARHVHQPTFNLDLACIHLAAHGHQPHHAVVIDQRGGAAAARDRLFGQPLSRTGRQQHLAALGLDQLPVFHQRGDAGRIDLHAQQPVVREIEGHRITSGHRHRAQARLQHSFVAHLRREQGHVATIDGADLALVEHAGGAAVAAELEAPGKEVGIAELQRAGSDAAHVHARAGAEGDAIRVDQHHLAVGAQAAEDRRRIGRGHAVERDRGGAWLLEIDVRVGADVKRVPVQDRLRTALRHVHARAALVDARLAGHHLAAGRQCVDGRGLRACGHRGAGHPGQQHRTQQGTRRARTAFAASAGVFGHGDKGAAGFVPDQAIDAIQGTRAVFHGVLFARGSATAES